MSEANTYNNVQKMNIKIQQDGKGYTARIKNTNNIFAHGISAENAKAELLNVIEMMIDVHRKQIKT